MNYQILKGDNKIFELQKNLGSITWPEFMQHDTIVNQHWPELYTTFIDYQFAVIDNEEVVGIGNAIPINWQGTFEELPDRGLDWSMEKASDDFKSGFTPTLLVGVQILINQKFQKQGISYEMLKIMKDLAKANGIDCIALPLRPTLKSRYPLIPITDYINWQNKDKLPFDPWLRVHYKEGGKYAGICDKSMHITGTISEWEKWTGMKFQESGKYIVDNALVPIIVDKDTNTGKYIEPNVWIIHKVN